MSTLTLAVWRLRPFRLKPVSQRVRCIGRAVLPLPAVTKNLHTPVIPLPQTWASLNSRPPALRNAPQFFQGGCSLGIPATTLCILMLG
jgi:hypothetical protein